VFHSAVPVYQYYKNTSPNIVITRGMPPRPPRSPEILVGLFVQKYKEALSTANFFQDKILTMHMKEAIDIRDIIDSRFENR
jgi:hypothetical protein